MDCPRCGARLSRLSLGDRRSVYCEECGFADVESDHTRTSDGEETWADAIRRFRAAHAGDGAGADGAAPDDGSFGDELDDAAAEPVAAVDGIGPAYAGRLAAVGITTLGGLATADAGAVAGPVDVPEPTAADWIARARRILAAADDGGGDAAPRDADSGEP